MKIDNFADFISTWINLPRQKIALFVAKTTFVVNGMIFQVVVMVSLVVKTTVVVTEITFLRTDIKLLVANITFVDTYRNLLQQSLVRIPIF